MGKDKILTGPNSVYNPLLAEGLRMAALLVALCYLDNKAFWPRNGSYTRTLGNILNLNNKTMTDSIIIALLSPILITVGGLITWFLKTRQESLQLSEERSREKRMETYKEILEPFIILITPAASHAEKDKATSIIRSTKYKKATFDFITFGSDETVRCYNSMMQFIFNNQSDETMKLIKIFAGLILNIRKDLYSRRTKLKKSEILAFTITDIENYKQILDK
jgi:hypothetical protein